MNAYEAGRQPDSAGFLRLAKCAVRREAEGAMMGVRFQEDGPRPIGGNSDEEKDI